MKDTVTIVTAFVDIGRGHWEGVKNNHLIPPYIKRDNEVYFQRSERLTKLKNPIIVFTESKHFDRLLKMRDDIQLIGIDTVFEDHKHLMSKIEAVQNDPYFIKFVSQPSAPEYWSSKYVAINFLKSHFVHYAITEGIVKTSTAAWIDFGYVRDETFCPPGMEWKFNADNKINIFCIDPYTHSMPIFEVIRQNKVFIQGCHIVAPIGQWYTLKHLMNDNLSTMFNLGLVDDDQTLLLMSYRSAPQHFKLNIVDPKDWFVIFSQYNHD